MTRTLCWLLLALAVTTLEAEPPQLKRPTDPPSIEPRDADDQNPPSLAIPPQLPPITADGPAAPAGAEEVPRADERTRQRIQQALEGGAAIETGDPILDETLRVIRGRGSVLRDWPADQALYHSEPLAGHAPPPMVSESHYRTAESLLRSARLLSQLPHGDNNRQQLIHWLRSEARRCLAAGGEPAGAPSAP